MKLNSPTAVVIISLGPPHSTQICHKHETELTAVNQYELRLSSLAQLPVDQIQRTAAASTAASPPLAVPVAAMR